MQLKLAGLRSQPDATKEELRLRQVGPRGGAERAGPWGGGARAGAGLRGAGLGETPPLGKRGQPRPVSPRAPRWPVPKALSMCPLHPPTPGHPSAGEQHRKDDDQDHHKPKYPLPVHGPAGPPEEGEASLPDPNTCCRIRVPGSLTGLEGRSLRPQAVCDWDLLGGGSSQGRAPPHSLTPLLQPE